MKYILIAGAFCLAFVSCKKDDDNGGSGQTKTELLTTGSWKYESGGFSLDGNTSIDYSFEMAGVPPACALDNVGTFSANGSGVMDEGTLKCNQSAPQTSAFTWALSNNDQNLNIGGSGFAGLSGQFKVQELTTTRLSLSKDTTGPGGISALVILNLKH